MSSGDIEHHPKVNPPRIATCPHCGNRTPHELLHRQDYREPEEFGRDDAYFDERWFAILKCGTCRCLSLYVDHWNDRDGRWEAALAHPQKLQAPPEVPETVAHEFDQAVSAQQQMPGLAASRCGASLRRSP